MFHREIALKIWPVTTKSGTPELLRLIANTEPNLWKLQRHLIVGMSFAAAIGILLVVLGCALKEFQTPKGPWWVLFNLFFYVLAPIPALITRRLGGDFTSFSGSSNLCAEISLFFTSGIVISAFGLPIVLARAQIIKYGAMALVMTGNLFIFCTILAFFLIFDGIMAALRSMFRMKTSGLIGKRLITNVSMRLQSSLTSLEFETLKVTSPAENVINVELNRPKKLNAMNKLFFKEMVDCFEEINKDTSARVVILSGSGNFFTAGLDLMDYASTFMQANEGGDDVARKAWKVRQMITDMQKPFNIIEKCPQPVIAAIHSGCIGGGVDMISACDVRLCSSDAWFQIKEVDIGLAADLGTLQRLSKVTGNASLVRELCYTARKFHSDEAKAFGLVSGVYPDKESLMESAVSMATQIAEKSPVAVTGTKQQLNYARDHSVEEGLNQVMTWNMSMIQTEDIMKAVQAFLGKSKATFSKL
eukprot:gene8144-9014_t